MTKLIFSNGNKLEFVIEIYEKIMYSCGTNETHTILPCRKKSVPCGLKIDLWKINFKMFRRQWEKTLITMGRKAFLNNTNMHMKSTSRKRESG